MIEYSSGGKRGDRYREGKARVYSIYREIWFAKWEYKKKARTFIKGYANFWKACKMLGLSKEEIQLATLIGLLHDIGRFEQYVRFKNYGVIKEFDHGDYAVEILKKIWNFIKRW